MFCIQLFERVKMFTKEKLNRGWKILLYGRSGCGKSTLAGLSERPAFLDLEDGLVHLDVFKTPYLMNFDDYRENLRNAMTDDNIKTIVIDTLDGLESLLTKKILDENGKESLADFGYGRGYDLLMTAFSKEFDIFDKISRKNKNILMVAHEQIEKYADPTSEPYDRYAIKLHKKSSQVLVARADCVLFCDYEKIVKKNNSDEKLRGIGQGKRVVFTQEKPSFIAKNRFGLPERMPMTDELFTSIDKFLNHKETSKEVSEKENADV